MNARAWVGMVVAVLLVGCSSKAPEETEPDEPASGSSGKRAKKKRAKSSAAPSSTAVEGAPEGERSPSTTPPVASQPPSGTGITISIDPDGPNNLNDEQLKGDPKTCAAVKACCNEQGGALALGCQLAVAESAGDCEKMLKTVRTLAKELGNPPAGCK